MKNKSKKRRILIIAPGYGHNINSTLDRLNGWSDYEVDFLAVLLDESFRNKYSNINLISFDVAISKPLKAVKNWFILFRYLFFNGRYDIFIAKGVQGEMVLFATIFGRAKTKIQQFWNNPQLELSTIHSFRGKVCYNIIRFADYIFLNGWEIKEHFEQLYPQYKNKAVQIGMSISDELFATGKRVPTTSFVKEFLESIPDDEIVCFWPRSIIRANRQDMLVQAISIIKANNPELLSKFKLYLWCGNSYDLGYRKEIEAAAAAGNISDIVVWVEHPYVPENDLYAIEQRSDFFVQISEHDILSSFIWEIILSGKPFLITELRAFEFLNRTYHLDIDFVPKTVPSIVNALQALLEGNVMIDRDLYDHRLQICQGLRRSQASIKYKQLIDNM